jgi:AI-2 transport protein TqsA
MARSHARTIRVLFGLACLVIVLAGMRATSGILNPILLAGFITMLMEPVMGRMRRLGGLAALVVILLLIVAGLGFVAFLVVSAQRIAGDLPTYEAQLDQVATSITTAFAARGIDIADYVESFLSGPRITRMALSLSGQAVGLFTSLGLTVFIAAFMLGGVWETERRAKRGARDHSEFAARIVTFAATVRRYMTVRAMLGFAAATLNYVVLRLLHIDYAGLWAVLSFVFSFIPNIGYFMALVPPLLLALLSGGWMRALMVLAGFQLINTLTDNVVGPRFVGQQLNMSPLLTFLSVVFWGWVLGPIGAILSVPLTVLVKDLTSTPVVARAT